jgi:hypothetical protein
MESPRIDRPTHGCVFNDPEIFSNGINRGGSNSSPTVTGDDDMGRFVMRHRSKGGILLAVGRERGSL